MSEARAVLRRCCGHATDGWPDPDGRDRSQLQRSLVLSWSPGSSSLPGQLHRASHLSPRSLHTDRPLCRSCVARRVTGSRLFLRPRSRFLSRADSRNDVPKLHGLPRRAEHAMPPQRMGLREQRTVRRQFASGWRSQARPSELPTSSASTSARFSPSCSSGLPPFFPLREGRSRFIPPEILHYRPASGTRCHTGRARSPSHADSVKRGYSSKQFRSPVFRVDRHQWKSPGDRGDQGCRRGGRAASCKPATVAVAAPRRANKSELCRCRSQGYR